MQEAKVLLIEGGVGVGDITLKMAGKDKGD